MRRWATTVGLTLASLAVVASAGSPASAAPTADFNHVTISGNVRMLDSEFGRDDVKTYPIKQEPLRLVQNGPGKSALWQQCHGGELRAELDVTATRIAGRSGWVHVVATSRLFEERTCANQDLEDVQTVSFDMAPNSSKSHTVELRSGEGTRDQADVRFTVKNFHNWEG